MYHTQMSHIPPPPPPPQASSSPAHGVIVIGVTEAGGLQLAAHHGAGALIARQVALKSTLTVHAGTWDSADKHMLLQAFFVFIWGLNS